MVGDGALSAIPGEVVPEQVGQALCCPAAARINPFILKSDAHFEANAFQVIYAVIARETYSYLP